MAGDGGDRAEEQGEGRGRNPSLFRSVEIKTDRWMYRMKEGGQDDASLEGWENEREEESPYMKYE